METGMQISISIGGGVAHSCVVSEMIHGKIEIMSEKAVKISNDNGSIWIPKKALSKNKKYDFYELSKWFKPDYYQRLKIDKMATISGISAA